MSYVYKRELLGELILNFLTKSTLPKSVSNYLGNVFVPNGIHSKNSKTTRKYSGHCEPADQLPGSFGSFEPEKDTLGTLSGH